MTIIQIKLNTTLYPPVVFRQLQKLIEFEIDDLKDTFLCCLSCFFESGCCTELDRISSVERSCFHKKHFKVWASRFKVFDIDNNLHDLWQVGWLEFFEQDGVDFCYEETVNGLRNYVCAAVSYLHSSVDAWCRPYLFEYLVHLSVGLWKAFSELIELMNEYTDISAAGGEYFGERQRERVSVLNNTVRT